ncbi:MAG TPA: DegT/DnrJ/EryC1/StrS family aminotransferase [Ktedonobacteraceae bacterium]|nr:DegT/DnrJ/EryC1/StrS family aminotransferase [Ktedonobacteraceae bacterium]
MPTNEIPLNDLQAEFQSIKHEVMPAIERVLDGMQLFLGPQCHRFEEDFARYCGSRYGVAVSNGTDALVLALRACQVSAGDEVITVANTFIATVEAIAQVGARPVFIDIDPQTYVMDWRQIEAVVTPRTRAIIPVHLFGHPVEMQPVLDIARRHNLRVIEDASQAHGATYQGRRVGSFGDIACFSLYYSKNLGAYGEAGICTTGNGELAETLRILRDHGSRVRYQHDLLGMNNRIDELQAAILNVKLPYLDRWNARRQSHARAYNDALQDIVEQIPVARSWASHVYYVYVIQVRERDHFRNALQQAAIGTGVHYPIPLHLQSACRHYGYAPGSLPITEAASERIVSLPMYPELTGEQIERVISTIRLSRVTRATARVARTI